MFSRLNVAMLACIMLTSIVQLQVAFAQTSAINDTGTLMSDLLLDYNLYVRPAVYVNDTVNVTMSLSILSIKQYDEKEGTLSFIAILGLAWNDSRMMWDPYVYGDIEEMLVGYDEVWVPDLYCVNSAVTFIPVGTKKERVRFDYTGIAKFSPGALFTVSCAGNMEKYPYDSQTCHISFNAWNYNEKEVFLIPKFEEIDLNSFSGSNMWMLGETRVTNELYSGGLQLDFFMEISRKSRFVTVNVVVPLFFLNCLNNLVFLLVPESGERISFCITVLLSISVYLTILNQTLPQSSEPVPVISYKVIADLAVSYLIILMVVINLKLYNKPDNEKVPHCLQAMYKCFSCSCRKTKGIMPSKYPDGMNEWVEGEGDTDKPQAKLPYVKVENESKESVTWRDISAVLDSVCFVVFNCVTLCSLYMFIRMTYI